MSEELIAQHIRDKLTPSEIIDILQGRLAKIIFMSHTNRMYLTGLTYGPQRTPLGYMKVVFYRQNIPYREELIYQYKFGIMNADTREPVAFPYGSNGHPHIHKRS